MPIICAQPVFSAPPAYSSSADLKRERALAWPREERRRFFRARTTLLLPAPSQGLSPGLGLEGGSEAPGETVEAGVAGDKLCCCCCCCKSRSTEEKVVCLFTRGAGGVELAGTAAAAAAGRGLGDDWLFTGLPGNANTW